MEQNYPEEFERLTKYVSCKSMQLLERLGSGVEGLVYSTNNGSAVKAHRAKALFENEMQVYERLKRHPDNDFAGFYVPKLEEYHLDCWVIEMELGYARVPTSVIIEVLAKSDMNRSADDSAQNAQQRMHFQCLFESLQRAQSATPL